ncbi:MAG: hypothetical protein M1150_03450 [Patescibacteria group bacterium]|nr:hypothetical protein [Patescibacteria group bacterium]
MEQQNQKAGVENHCCNECGEHECPLAQPDPKLEEKMHKALKKDLMETRGITEEQAEEELKKLAE